MYKTGTIILVAFIFLALPLRGQQYPLATVPDISGGGRFIQRTMHLLASSTPEKKNTVKIWSMASQSANRIGGWK
ncbi:hypothetical protein BH20BAC1_BH20BAC1_24030 [soil metagenome]